MKNKPEDFLDNSKYQVFLFICPTNLPFVFASHPWFVLNKKGELSRWEHLVTNKVTEKDWNHLHKDLFPPFKGVGVIPWVKKFLWEAKLINFIEGDKGSLAERMVEFIEKSPENFPYCKKYSFLGPNSNTYGQWVLNNFPEFEATLPWNSYGKSYK